MNVNRFLQVVGGLACLLVFWSAADAAETPETIRIRRTMANELSGYRRADADMVLSAYHEEFTALHAHGNIDPRAWTVEFESITAYAEDLRTDLRTYRYDTYRTLPFIHVRDDYAMVTSLDSGLVVDRSTKAERQVKVRRFWTVRKQAEDWLITSVVDELGDSLVAVGGPPGSPEPGIVQFLQAEAQAWEGGETGLANALYQEHLIGIDGYGNADPAKWKIVFAGNNEFGTFLDFRLNQTDYTVERNVVFTTLGPEGKEAVAVTREKISTAHARGDMVHEMERDVLWALTQRSGEWRIRHMCYGIGLND